MTRILICIRCGGNRGLNYFSTFYPPSFRRCPNVNDLDALAAQVIHFEEEEFGHVGGEHVLVVLGKDGVIKTAFGELPVQKPKPEWA
jgi:hypothetical protein